MRQRRFRKLGNLIRHLPSTSHYMAAVATDDEVAAQVAKLPEDKRAKPNGPSLTEWSPEVQQLALIADVLSSLRALFLNANGVKTPQPKPQPRPRTALAAQKHVLRKARHDALVARWGPPRPEARPE